MITVRRSAPLLTVQDRGRFGYYEAGITRSGPLDALAFDVANALVGNAVDSAALEGCLGGAEFSCDDACTLALTGATLTASLNGTPIDTYVAYDARPGDVLTIEHVIAGVVWYLAVAGGVDTPVVLRSRATLLAAELGGVNGAPIRPRTSLAVGHAPGAALRKPVPVELRATLDNARLPLLPAPRSDALDAAAWTAFYETAFTVSRASNRVGYRLEGVPVVSHLPADLASEPACAGAMQLPPEGQPIVLMADHPTIGGYPIIGVVPAFALGALAQRSPGSAVRFAPMTTDDARAQSARVRKALSNWVTPD